MSLKILNGIYCKKEIKLPRELKIRPTLVRARKMIFDTIDFLFPDRNFTFLDVFAGSGIMGLEALSRGAKKSIFFEKEFKIIRNLRENLNKMEKFYGLYEVICTNSLCPPTGTPVDIIFIDPPYDKYFIIKDIIKKLKKYNWIDLNTLIIIEYFFKDNPELQENLVLQKEIIISQSKFKFLKFSTL